MHILKNLFIVVFLSFLFSIKGEAQTTEQSDFSELKKCTVFSAGDDNVNSYRIPLTVDNQRWYFALFFVRRVEIVGGIKAVRIL